MRNPAIGTAAAMAGYVRGDAGLDLIRAAAGRVAAGQSLLVFPEGTRTAPGTAVGAMRPGFALIADRARAPVTLMGVRATPIVPCSIEVTLDRTWPHVPGRSAAELTRSVEARICEVLAAAKPA
jgi:1-acyl-sn-glycerol-3-phosphate acyltransferase